MSEAPAVFVAWDPERGHSVAVRLGGLFVGAMGSMGSVAALFGVSRLGGPLAMLVASLSLVAWALRRGPHVRIDALGIQRPRWNDGHPLTWKEIEKVSWDPRTDALTVHAGRPVRSFKLRVSRYEQSRRERMRAVLQRYLGHRLVRRVDGLPPGAELPPLLPVGSVVRPEKGPLTWGALGLLMIGSLVVIGYLATGSEARLITLVAAGLLLLLYTRHTAHIRVAPMGLEVRQAFRRKPEYVSFTEIDDIRLGDSRGLLILRRNEPRVETSLQISALTFARLEATVLDQAVAEVFA
ncbi:MAG: hypothetical protein AB7T63_13960 [Planctomycetota bacterium]